MLFANEQTGLPTQMSHRWILRALNDENLTAEGQKLLTSINRMHRSVVRRGAIDYPYHRWITLVTGRQLHKHQKSRGVVHETQTTLTLPNNILEE
jgi:hypothetical protein